MVLLHHDHPTPIRNHHGFESHLTRNVVAVVVIACLIWAVSTILINPEAASRSNDADREIAPAATTEMAPAVILTPAEPVTLRAPYQGARRLTFEHPVGTTKLVVAVINEQGATLAELATVPGETVEFEDVTEPGTEPLRVLVEWEIPIETTDTVAIGSAGVEISDPFPHDATERLVVDFDAAPVAGAEVGLTR